MFVVALPIKAPVALLEDIRSGVMVRTLVFREGILPASVIAALSVVLKNVT